MLGALSLRLGGQPAVGGAVQPWHYRNESQEAQHATLDTDRAQ
jgi:hypothetical protein